MKRFVGLVCCVLMSVSPVFAQSKGKITGKLIDSSTGDVIIGAVVEVSRTGTAVAKKYFTTEAGGAVNLHSLDYGQYELVFSYLGYKKLEKTVTVNGPAVDIGTLKIEPTSLLIDQVTLEVPAMRTSVKGDTVSYNAAAFKVAADADTEGLLAKMPGISIVNGVVEAQGEEVRRVLVDGREFFGDDVTSAIRNLPAEVVERIEVFNKLSDQAEFTGMDDGEGYKAINIVTASDKRSGQFGKLYAAYGIPDRYIAGGNVNIFQGESRISLIGLANNLNQQNFSFEDILGVVNTGGTSSGGGSSSRGGGGGTRGFMVRPQEGIATVQSFGVNYSDKWGEKVDFTGSYFFNHSDTRNHNSTRQWNYTNTDVINYTGSEADTRANNYNHRFNARINYRINSNHTLMIRPSFSFQTYDNEGTTISNRLRLLGDTETPVQGQRQINNSERSGFNGGANILYRARLGKQGRTLTLNVDGNASDNSNFSLPEQYIYYPVYNPALPADSVYNQRTLTDTRRYRIGGGVTYTEPLGERSQLSLEYRARYNYSDYDKKVYKWLEDAAVFDEEIARELSSLYNSGYLTHDIGPGYRYSDQKSNVSARVSYQYATLQNTQQLPLDRDDKYAFGNVVYSMMANFNFNSANTLRVNAWSNTENPSISQLSDVTDLSNIQYVTSGNSDLTPTYNHRIMAHYINSNALKGRTFTIMMRFDATSDYIADSIVMNNPTFELPNTGTPPLLLGVGNQFSKPVNMNGNWRIYSGISYGLPVKFLRSNLNFDLGGMFGQTPGIINGDKYTMKEQAFNGGITLSSNISENLDFTIRYRGNYNVSTSTTFTNTGTGTAAEERLNKYFSQSVTGSVKWVFWKGITFTGTAAYTQDKGITDDYNEHYLLCNLFVGKKIFRNQRGEISVGVNDLFNQNISFRRTVNGNRITNSLNDAVGRYFSVQFIYNLRNFGKRASRNSRDYEGLEAPSGAVGVQRSNMRGGPGGPPPGGFR